MPPWRHLFLKLLEHCESWQNAKIERSLVFGVRTVVADSSSGDLNRSDTGEDLSGWELSVLDHQASPLVVSSILMLLTESFDFPTKRILKYLPSSFPHVLVPRASVIKLLPKVRT